LVRHEFTVLRADARVLFVVVELARLDEVRELLRDLGVLAVPLDQVHDVVRDHRREPARLLTRVGDVVGDVARRADDARALARVAPGPLGRAASSVHDPLDDHRVGELDDHAVRHVPRDGERLRAVTRDPQRDLRQLPPHPLQLELLVVPLNGAAVHQLFDHRAAPLELGDAHGLEPDDAAGRVATADTHHHPAVRDVLHRRVPARGDRWVADAGVRDEMPELDLARLRSRERQRRVGLLPEDVRVVRPRVLEAVVLCELHQLDHPLVGRVRQDRDAEAEHGASPVAWQGNEHIAAKSPRTVLWLYLLFAFAGGVALPFQAGINAALGGGLRGPGRAGLVFFLLRAGLPFVAAPPLF